MKKLLIFSILFLTPTEWLNADELFFTYIGAAFGGGLDKIKYTDWFRDSDKRDTKKVSGSFYSGGFVIDIFVNKFIGEFSIQYINNSNSDVPDISVNHLIYNATGKYSYKLIDALYLTSGLGLYLETPPANRSYNSGGGFNATFGTVYNIGREWKVIFDLIARYGHFGIGEDSTRLSYGARIGLVYKIGRI